MRDDPGLDLEGAVAAQGRELSADDLRFSLPQIDSFLDGELPLQELDALERRTEGWPVALRIYRNMRRRDAHLRPTTSDMLADRSDLAKWFGKRLLGRLKREDRRLLLDLALFDWISPALADEALNTADVQQRIESLGALDGLLVAQEGDDAGTWRMNPLLKEYCIDQGSGRTRSATANCAAASPGWRRAPATWRRRCATPTKPATARSWARFWKTPAACACGPSSASRA